MAGDSWYFIWAVRVSIKYLIQSLPIFFYWRGAPDSKDLSLVIYRELIRDRNLTLKPGQVVYACNSCTQEAETGGSWVWVSLGYMWDPISKTKQTNKKTLLLGPCLIHLPCCLSGHPPHKHTTLSSSEPACDLSPAFLMFGPKLICNMYLLVQLRTHDHYRLQIKPLHSKQMQPHFIVNRRVFCFSDWMIYFSSHKALKTTLATFLLWLWQVLGQKSWWSPHWTVQSNCIRRSWPSWGEGILTSGHHTAVHHPLCT
jgi:hypothetical protein